MYLSSVGFELHALTFPIRPGSDIVGEVQTATVQAGETMHDIARRFDLGIYELIEANPNVSPWKPPKNSVMVIPSKFILPPGPRRGIVLNLAEMRLYYYQPYLGTVSTYPIGIGRKGWLTPLAKTTITQKTKNPSWYPPKSIREHFKSMDRELPTVVHPGPNNPLGKFAMRLELTGYLIHGTNRPEGVGVRSSSGCIRMYPEDIKALFYNVKLGEEVRIIHNPLKIGMKNNKVYMEAHEPLAEPYYGGTDSDEHMLRLKQAYRHMTRDIDWDYAETIMHTTNGFPTRLN